MVFLLLPSCSSPDQELKPSPQFQNYSFDRGGLSPWENIVDPLNGQPWKYDGKYSQSVFVRGWGIKTHSQLLMQRNFPAGTYTIEIQVDNQNEVAGIEVNGMLKVVSIDQYGTWEHDYIVLTHGYQRIETSFTLIEDFNMIGFEVGRIGRGTDLNMSVLEFKIVGYEK